MATENNNEQSNQQQDNIEKHLDIAIEAQDGKQQTNNEDTSTGSETGTDANANSGKANDKGGTSGGGDSTSQQRTDEKGKKEEERAASANKGKDLVDAQGNVLAKAGQERRFFEQREVARQEAQHLRGQLSSLQNELTRVQGELKTARDSVTNVQGVPPEQLGIAVNIFRDLQRDPVGTVKKLLAEVKANGHNVDGIGADVDTLAIQRMIANNTGNQKQDEPSEADVAANAKRTADEFFGRHPDARPHDSLLAQVLRDNPGVDLDTAYFQLRGAFAEKGFDWNLSLEDNLRASGLQQNNQQSNQQNVGNQQQQNNQHQAPLLGGRNVDTGAVVEANKPSIAHETEDWDSIIRGAMAEAGLKPN